ncbi:nucleoside hydrolase [Telluribacter humicola]|uniref:nucleoside hydrolase n=1 Tax=Telluribacter humicola TaxID=1720261 RepID=UPI001E4367EA|nr:nucleoside hydrolase [Telluribacter humicola]
MNHYLKAFLFSLSLLMGFNAQAQRYSVILDTDIDSDVDDVEALAMLHTLADQKKIHFKGVIVTSDDPYAPTCTAVINQYYGRPNLPVGFLKNQPALKNHSKYTRQLSEEYPHSLDSQEKTQDATELYRQLLSKSPDGSVVIITVGHLTNLQNLLQSGSDKYSPLSGKELVQNKVARWLCMGGTYPEGKEANFYRPDPGSTVYCLQEWKKPVVFAGWEVGDKIKTGGAYLKSKLTTSSPVYRAYELYNSFQGRASWDQVAVFLLMDASKKYFDTVKEGYCHVNEDGSNQWRTDRDSLHEYVILKPGADVNEIARLMDQMAIR